jgi:site-specific DNA-methyltransferase (adenine-specific)
MTIAQGEGWTLIHGDCLDVLPTLDTGSVDLIVTDPPYGIGYASSRTTRNGGGPRKSRASFGQDVFNAEWLLDAARMLKDGGALYLCTRWDVIHLWRKAIEDAGLSVAQRLVWDKSHWGMGDLRYFGSQIEDVLFAVKGEHRLLWDKRQGNVWKVWRGEVWRDGFCDHPTQKPVALMQKAVELSCPVGGVVLDPFMGSGTTGVACLQTGRRFIGIELDAAYFEIARQRLEAASAQTRLAV